MIDFEQKVEVSRILVLVNALHSELEKEMAIFGEVLELADALTNVLTKADVRGIFDMDDLACKFLSNYPLTDDMVKLQVDVIGNALHTLRQKLKVSGSSPSTDATLFDALTAISEAYKVYDTHAAVKDYTEEVKVLLAELL